MANRVIMRDRACAQCGTRPISGYKFCSDKCAGRDRVAPHPCLHCGQITRRPKYCSVQCGWVARERRKGVRPIDEYKAGLTRIQRKCPECCKLFTPTRFGEKHVSGQQVYCSRDCRYAESRRRADVREMVRREAALYRRWAAAARAEAKAERLCKCGAALPKFKHQCADCSEVSAILSRRKSRESPATKAARRRAKARRRAIERGARADRFDPFEIFDRDGWRCHMCGCSTPKRLRGTYEGNAPELDHLVPLAAGGEHSRRNTACACRRCNLLKADKPMGQLRLFG